MSTEKPDIYQYKSYLFTIAYSMVGEIPVAEDLVQDTFEKWLSTDTAKVIEMKPYLSRILINKAIDKLEKLTREREAYKGLWLPEPLITNDEHPPRTYAGICVDVFVGKTKSLRARCVYT